MALGLLDLQVSLRHLKGIGVRYQQTFSKVGISTVRDLLYYYPHYYQDRRKIIKIAESDVDRFSTFKVKVCGHKSGYFVHRRIKFSELILSDETGTVRARFYNSPGVLKDLYIGRELVISGRLQRDGKKLYINDFDYELADSEDFVHTRRIVPFYPLADKLGGQRWLRRIINFAIEQVKDKIVDPLPEWIRKKYNLIALADAIKIIHFPVDKQSYSEARKRLIFDECLVVNLSFSLSKHYLSSCCAKVIPPNSKLVEKFLSLLDFQLTEAQKQAIAEIQADMNKSRPMLRLLHGEVGSGKTVVAAVAAVCAVSWGWQVAFLVPTEVLAIQHYERLRALFDKVGVRVGLLVGSTKSQKEKLLSQLTVGNVDVIIGTHALIQNHVTFEKLGLCIIDEQQRFGVLQREALYRKAKNSPHILILSATPIPRTLSLTVYGGVAVSTLYQVPFERKIESKCMSFSEISQVYDEIEQQLKKGHQAYIIYPTIEDNENLRGILSDAKVICERFRGFKVEILHGRLNHIQQQNIIQRFICGNVDLLLTTTVCEVGLDVPNATVMVIHHAERFGLAQLHQLRGRIGRRATASKCILVVEPYIAKLVNLAKPIEPSATDNGKSALLTAARLQAFIKHNDGFKLAQLDLALRGPGEFCGTAQHGMPEFKLTNIIKHERVLLLTNRLAHYLIKDEKMISKLLAGVKASLPGGFVAPLS